MEMTSHNKCNWR